MVLNKTLLASLLLASSLSIISSANAGRSGFDENENPIVSIKKLKTAWESGDKILTVQGKRFSITASDRIVPFFNPLYKNKQFTAFKSKKNNNEYILFHRERWPTFDSPESNLKYYDDFNFILKELP
jgi:hypothetical protein